MTSSDGVTWTEHIFTPTGMSSMMSLAILEPIVTSDGSIYIGAAASDSSYVNYAWYVFKSTDGGVTWTEADKFIDISPSSNYLSLMFKDVNENLYAIGSRYDGTNNNLIIRRSADAGSTWTQEGSFLNANVGGAKIDENGNILLFGTKSNSPLYDIYSISHSCN
ncbi:MAG: sialidase family protein [Bdellovibrionales bacterium]